MQLDFVERTRTQMSKHRLLQITLIGFLSLTFGQSALAQEEPAGDTPPRRVVITNRDFGVDDAPAKPAPAPETTTATAGSEAPATEVKKEEPEWEVAPKTIMNVVKDKDGRWVVTSTQVPGKAKVLVVGTDRTISTGKPELDKLITEAGQKHGVDPLLIMEVMRQESGFRQYAVSPAGAKGLMQFIDGTARRYGITDPFDPQQSIDGGARYLRDLLEMFNGNVELALAGYNAGENRVKRNGNQVPNIRETQAYVKNITSKYGSKQHYATKNASKKAQPAELPPPPPRVVQNNDGTLLFTNRE